MFNSVNNPFNRSVSSSTSSDSNGKRQKQDPKKELKKYLEEDEPDEVRLGGLPILTQDDVKSMVNSYISKLKEENSCREKVVQKLDKYLQKFDVVANGGLYSHQYMSNIMAASSEGIRTYNKYSNMGQLSNSFTFLIPVYDNMPNLPAGVKPTR